MFQVNCMDFGSLSTNQTSQIMKALNLWVRVWNTDEFKNAILNFKYTDPGTGKTYNNFYFTGDEQPFSNADVLDKLLGLNEGFVRNFSLDKGWAWPWSSVIAATDYSSQTTTLYKKFFNQNIYDMADTLAHEDGCHLAGFEHTFNWTPLRDSSVPYAVGYITGMLARQMGV